MAAKLGVLMQDQRLIPKIIKSHFCQKYEVRCFAFVRHTSKQTILVDAADAADMPAMVSSILTKSADTVVYFFTAA